MLVGVERLRPPIVEDEQLDAGERAQEPGATGRFAAVLSSSLGAMIADAARRLARVQGGEFTRRRILAVGRGAGARA